MARSALILFAHGARDPRWAVPFERVLEHVRKAAPQRSAMLAYLEMMTPDLPSAIATQVAHGFDAITVVPLFLGLGGHLRSDLPRLIERARETHPGLIIDVKGPAGEDDAVVAALCAYATN